MDSKEDWKREKKIKINNKKIKKIVSRKFLKQREVFGKVKLKRMPMRKV